MMAEAQAAISDHEVEPVLKTAQKKIRKKENGTNPKAKSLPSQLQAHCLPFLLT